MKKIIITLATLSLSLNLFASDNKGKYPTLISSGVINVTDSGMKIDPAQEAFYNLIKTQDYEIYTSTVDKSFIRVNKKDGKVTDIIENQQSSSKLGQVLNIDSSGKISSITRCDDSTHDCITFNNQICTGLEGFDKKLAACKDFMKLTSDLTDTLRSKEITKIQDENMNLLNGAAKEAKKVDSKASKFNLFYTRNKGSLGTYDDNKELLFKLVEMQKRCDALKADGYMSKDNASFSPKSKHEAKVKEAK